MTKQLLSVEIPGPWPVGAEELQTVLLRHFEGAQVCDLTPEWISVEDRLPEIRETVWALSREGKHYTILFVGPYDRLPSAVENATHWMPAYMPTPPPKQRKYPGDWISVEESLPSMGMCVWAWAGTAGAIRAYRGNDEWRAEGWPTKTIDEHITHWQTFLEPEPPA